MNLLGESPAQKIALEKYLVLDKKSNLKTCGHKNVVEEVNYDSQGAFRQKKHPITDLKTLFRVLLTAGGS